MLYTKNIAGKKFRPGDRRQDTCALYAPRMNAGPATG